MIPKLCISFKKNYEICDYFFKYCYIFSILLAFLQYCVSANCISYQFMVVKYFLHILHFPFLTVCSSLSLPIVCEFEEWFAQLLVGKPTLDKLHRVKA